VRIFGMDLFEETLSASMEEIEFELRGQELLAWGAFLLNPRRLRGSDFLMRWSQGVWSEHRLIEAANETRKYIALPYGPSGTAPHGVREFEMYFARLDQAGLSELKRPDLLIFRKEDEEYVNNIIHTIGGIEELPFTREESEDLTNLLLKAVVAIECENSLWKARMMPDFGIALTPQKRLCGKLGAKSTAVLPTIIVKEEDRAPLVEWQAKRNIKIHIWHAFYDLSYGIALNKVEQLVSSGHILPTQQTFQAPGGATTKKKIYKIWYQYGYLVGETREAPTLVAASIVDKNGHILPYVKFEGGRLTLSPDALRELDELAENRAGS
jgi:hypothetical protein